MRLDDLLRVSFRQVLRQRRRSLGVALAIALGTAGLIVIITMGQDVKEKVNEDLELLGGATLIKVFFDPLPEKYSVPREQEFSETTVDALRRFPGVAVVTVTSFKWGTILFSRYDHQLRLDTLAAVDEFFWVANSFSPSSGRFFGGEEINGRQRVCVLGEGIAQKLFGDEEAVGQLLTMEHDFYRVVGVLGGLGLGNLDEWVFLPSTTAKDRIPEPWSSESIYLRCKSWNDVKRVSGEVPEVVRSHQEAPGLRVGVKWDHLKRVMRMAWWIEFFVYLAIAATLILGGFGIWNIMMAGVQARTREIGLKKAIGAEDKDILSQFLTEALCLSLSAALVGIVLGRIVVEVLSRILGCQPPEELFLLCVGLGLVFSVILGVGAGLAPSIRASRMEVVYAVRFE